jgi:hypothetical protein
LIADPAERGRALAEFAQAVIPRLWSDLESSGVLPDSGPEARDEWTCFALYACVRGLVAAGGFNRETAAAIDSMHTAVLETWAAEDVARLDPMRALVADRYREYGEIGQEGGASGAASVTRRLGEACARHLLPAGPNAFQSVAELLGGMHEALAEGSAEAVRLAG